jgi:hypothetical protein
MNVIGHDHVTTDRPAMAFTCGAPLLDKDLSDVGCGQNATPVKSTSREEVNGMIDPNPVEAPEVTMHASFYPGSMVPAKLEFVVRPRAGITDPGYNAMLLQFGQVRASRTRYSNCAIPIAATPMAA